MSQISGTVSQISEQRATSRRQAARRTRGITLTLGTVLLIAGAALAMASLLAPQAVEKVYGGAKTAVTQQVDQARQNVLAQLPTVKLGVRGGIPELDRCDGTFTEMLSYERDGVPPVWAAHNNCGGDVILRWEVGQQVQIAGSDVVYEVTDIRSTSKIWSSTDDLVGLDGELALQSCFYGEDRMKFIALKPANGLSGRTSLDAG